MGAGAFEIVGVQDQPRGVAATPNREARRDQNIGEGAVLGLTGRRFAERDKGRFAAKNTAQVIAFDSRRGGPEFGDLVGLKTER